MPDPRYAYRQSAVHGANPVRLVILLYEQAAQDLRNAGTALERAEVEVRTRHINHALAVLAQLQGTLDRENGGEVSVRLESFYNMIRSRLWQAQLLASAEILNEVVDYLLDLREAWIQVESAVYPSQPARVPAAVSSSSDISNRLSSQPVDESSAWRA